MSEWGVTRRDFVKTSALGLGATVLHAASMPAMADPADPDLVAWWTFDEAGTTALRDAVSGVEDVIEGPFKTARGVRTRAIRLNGFSTSVVRKAASAPKLEGAFTITAWVALAARPWNWCPVVSQRQGEDKGYCLTIGPRGQASLQLSLDDQWVACTSPDFIIPVREWVYLAATYSSGQGLALYVNGRLEASSAAGGRVEYARDVDVRIGMNHQKVKPSNIHREFGTRPYWFSLDGLLDDIRIYKRALGAKDIEAAYALHKPTEAPDLPVRRMPSGPPGPGRFGAYYCRLKYYDEWDELWPVGPDPDVLVRFDRTAARVVFWRGSRYSPAWVSENDLWMADQSVEAWDQTEGCFEHMQDRHCRHAHVRVIESSDARAVVHWRYAPVSAYDHLWRVDEKTGWPCWVDEYYYIYPDATAVRFVSWKQDSLGQPRQFQESLPFTHPGQIQGDVVHADWVTIGNMKGESGKLSFIENPPKITVKPGLPGDLTIQIYNFKSANKPFIIFEPGNVMEYLTDRDIKALSRQGACDHWPVSQNPCDGRTAQTSDHPTHFLGFPISNPPIHAGGGRCWWHGLYGMTERGFGDLVRVARSWNHAPELRVANADFTSQGYSKAERAYQLTCATAGARRVLDLELAGSDASPIVNPALVVRHWGDARPEITVDGRRLRPGGTCRVGYRHAVDGTDLIVWLGLEFAKTIRVTLTPVGA
jgi:hypothetical protein